MLTCSNLMAAPRPVRRGRRRLTSVAAAAVVLLAVPAFSQSLLVPMDSAQTDHLKAYGLTYWCLQEPRLYQCEWLLNYRAGAFLLPDRPEVRARAQAMGVAVEGANDAALAAIGGRIQQENMERIVLTKAPRVAVYVRPDVVPWDDAVRLALDYAEIKYDKVWDKEVLAGKLQDYDWLHLHHEDFTGQFGKFFGTFQERPWYRQMVLTSRTTAQELGFDSVAKLKGAVANKIARRVANGGFVFAMCCAADSLDIALAAQGVNIVPPEIGGSPIAPDVDRRLDYSVTMAFKDFHLQTNPFIVQLSDIDVPPVGRSLVSTGEKFELFEFSAKEDPIPTMLTQCHVTAVADFLGQTTAFHRHLLKSTVLVMGDFPAQDKVKYIHGDYGKGTFTFYAGHDPEDYAHLIGDPPTDLSLHRHSPGYRLILNNILFPAAKVRQKKT